MKRCMAILAMTLVPAVVCAQETKSTWPGVKMETAGSPTVHVLDDTGTETSGKLLRFDRDAIVLLVDDMERRIEAARVTRIEKRGDSLRNGAIIGAVVGVAMALSIGRMADCPGSNPGGPCPGFRAASVLMFTGIGAGIDAVIVGRTTLYEAPRTAPRSAWALDGRRIGINMSVRW